MEKDIFGHLLDIENSAATLVFDAQVEADKRLSAAGADAEKEYKTEYEALIAEFEENFLKEKTAVDDGIKNEYEKFGEYLFALKKDYKKFEDYLNSYFFGA
ncbi:hypothetical protein [Treponema pedis]|uniref:Uncharacterized protein n=1 Tax=Treponema pedis str. T A4 TaxID=1291379 RepID=S5ZUX7_9SPIR|nr:hypothetical protein [Treponema pedis]AGT44020.1 hypothetical protein TPE_1525 [Treponema pedis str. T A4]